ncbi:DUF4340 domain-containing protein [Lutispora thermophila]|uniref:DUF4340 domain-containing protein n=1 Tax=Lutispora thermophila DSM 19022 TaxID=1122184 RepID=A0A1M6D4H3_9FIRM|nr:DUF4340 domain-containing protein [Lutispora thermophila]SHI68137.1 protein of unknown function [Lutispora thermophila DSM 19022]
MKRSKKIYMLLGILAVCCIATFSVIKLEDHKEKIKNSDKIILEISPDSVQSLSWKYKSKALGFHKDEKWLYDEDEAFPVDEEKINDMLKQFEKFGVSFIIEDVEDYGQYGLDNPTCTINLSTKEKSYEIQLGNYSEMDSQRYVSIGDGNVYLVKNDPLDYFDAVLSDMIDHDEIPKLDDVKEIQFKGAEAYSIAYEEDSSISYSEDDVFIAKKDGRDLPLDTTRVKKYLKNISNLNLNDYMTYKASDEELQKYGLNEPELTVTVNYISKNDKGKEVSNNFVLNISRDPKERKAAKKVDNKESDSSDEEEIKAYARVGESKILYKITSYDYKNLTAASYDCFRYLEAVPADFEDIYKIDISLEDADYTITSDKRLNKRAYYYQGEELETTDLKKALENLKADKFTDEQPTQKKEIGLKVYLDNKNYPEIQIQLYRYDGTYCLAVIDGKPVSLIKRSNVVDLIEAVHAIVLN